MSWAPELAEAFTPVSGGRPRVDGLPVSVAACLAAHAMNIGYRPVAKKGVPAPERARLSHVYQNYVRPETLASANAPLVARQAGLPLAQAWGGGLVAAVDGMRFVVPVPAAFAHPNRKYFGSKRGMTWLTAINDRGMGRGAKIVSGTVRDSLHMVDVIFGLDGGETYRRDIKGIRNLQEGRHALARKICHGKKGELYHRYERGLENQLGALGLVLNCVVLWTTVYLDAAVRQLRAQGYPVLEEDMARLSPFVGRHLGVLGTYSFVLPDLALGAIRELRAPDAGDDDDD
jgi:TnpA family transposase